MIRSRSYQRSGWAAVLAVGVVLGTLAVVVPAETAVYPDGTPFPLAFKITWAIIGGAIFCFGLRAATSRIAVTNNGVVVHNTSSTRCFDWSEIAGFDVGPMFPYQRVIRVIRTDHSVSGCRGLAVRDPRIAPDPIAEQVLHQLNQALAHQRGLPGG